ncbi:MAG: hypothetical protein JSV31_12370 [Desulfobacterales bacterium]|nr:MAG: hypothetical protein JSV31_12370 [Desulfobacterales bacterium]
MENLLKNNNILIEHITHVLYERNGKKPAFPQEGIDLSTASAVMFLLGKLPKTHLNSGKPCLILNKRSVKVKQPGDLCCPGGSITPRLDPYLAKLFGLPLLPLARWPYWSNWQRQKPQEARMLALLFATSVRESFEEMRLNPFGLKFLGLLPSQSLVMFERVIYPLVAWTDRQQRFYPNWEVEKVIYIPLRDLLNSGNYVRYRLQMGGRSNRDPAVASNDFLCFRHRYRNENELLWGATYRITTVFLEYVFDFTPPEITSLPVVNGSLDENYLTGKR